MSSWSADRDKTTYRGVYSRGRYEDEPHLGRYEKRAESRSARKRSSSRSPRRYDPHFDDRRWSPHFKERSRDDDRDHPARSPHYDNSDRAFSSPIPRGPKLGGKKKKKKKKKKTKLIERTDVHSQQFNSQKEDSTAQFRQTSIAGSAQQSEMSPSAPTAKKRKLESSGESEICSAVSTPREAAEPTPDVPKRPNIQTSAEFVNTPASNSVFKPSPMITTGARTQQSTEILPRSATTTVIDSTRDPRPQAKSISAISVAPIALNGRVLNSISTSSQIKPLTISTKEGEPKSLALSTKNSLSSTIPQQKSISNDARSSKPASAVAISNHNSPSEQGVQTVLSPVMTNPSNPTTPSEGARPTTTNTTKDQHTINSLLRDILNRNADIAISKWKRDAHRESTQSNKVLLRSVKDQPDVREDLLNTLRNLEADANVTEKSLDADLAMKRIQINDPINLLVKAVYKVAARNDSPNMDAIRAELKESDTKIRDEIIKRQDELILRVKANEDLMLAPFGSGESYTTDLTRLLSNASSRTDTECEHVETNGSRHNPLSWHINSQDKQIVNLRESVRRLEGIEQSLDLSRRETEIYKNQVTALSNDFIKFREDLTAEKIKSQNLTTAAMDMANSCQMLHSELESVKAKLKVNQEHISQLQSQSQNTVHSQIIPANMIGFESTEQGAKESDRDRSSELKVEMEAGMKSLEQSLSTAGHNIEDLNKRVQKIELQEGSPSTLDQAEVASLKNDQKTTSDNVDIVRLELIERDEILLEETKDNTQRFEQISSSISTIEAVIGRYFPANTKSIAALQEENRSLANDLKAFTTDTEDRFRLSNNTLDQGNSSVENFKITVDSIDEQLKALQAASSEKASTNLDEHKVSALNAAVQNLNARFNSLSTETLATSIVGQMSKIYPHASSLQRSFDVQNMRITEIGNQTQKYVGDELAKLSGPIRTISDLQTRLENAERAVQTPQRSPSTNSPAPVDLNVNRNGNMAPPLSATDSSKQSLETMSAVIDAAKKEIGASSTVRAKMQSDITIMQQEIRVIQATMQSTLGQTLPQSPPSHNTGMNGDRSGQSSEFLATNPTNTPANALGITVSTSSTPPSHRAITNETRPNLENRRSSSGFTAVNSS